MSIQDRLMLPWCTHTWLCCSLTRANSSPATSTITVLSTLADTRSLRPSASMPQVGIINLNSTHYLYSSFQGPTYSQRSRHTNTGISSPQISQKQLSVELYIMFKFNRNIVISRASTKVLDLYYWCPQLWKGRGNRWQRQSPKVLKLRKIK